MVLPVEGYRSAMEFMAAMQGSEGDTHWLMKGSAWNSIRKLSYVNLFKLNG